MLTNVLDLWRGVFTPALVVGVVRAAVEAAVMTAAILIFSALGVHVPLQYLPLYWGAVRIIEGGIDHIDPAKQRAPGA